jgi:hypothetical protein
MDRQSISSIVPLVAVAITLAEFYFDHTQPRYASPWFWTGLGAIVILLVLMQVLRFVKKPSAKSPAKPDYSATSIIRSKSSFD